MPKIPVFGKDELKKACIDLGFDIYSDKGKGSHELAKHPTKTTFEGKPGRITIPHYKEIGDANLRSKIVNDICSIGFTRDDVITAINNNS